MDYEKKYKEALERARQFSEKPYLEDSKGIVDYIFHELKESEDEKIRKQITGFITYSRVLDETKKIWLAWLEKQGEQKSVEISNVCEFSIETWIKIVDFVLTEHNGIGNYLDDPEVKDTAERLQKKYKFDSASEECDRVYRKWLDAGVNKGRAEALIEQKPVWSQEVQEEQVNEEFINALGTMLNDGLPDRYLVSEERIKMSAELLFSIARKQVKNEMQAWSEEDERNLDWLITVCERIYYKSDPQVSSEGALILRDWLKSLKDRVQPKQERSKEEKKRIDRIIDVLDWAESKGRISYSDWEDYVTYVRCLRQQPDTKWYKLDDNIQKKIINYLECQREIEPTRKDILNTWIDWLKSLRPQNTWRPSDEQMKKLKEACDEHWEPDGLDPLYTLYQDLKRLMEK